jgi:PAS domain S-box-containing protein
MSNQNSAEALQVFSEDFCRLFFSNSPDPIVVYDPDYRIKYLNPAFINLTGFSYEELSGLRPPFPFQARDTGGDQGFLPSIDKFFIKEQVWKKKNGELMRVEATPVPIKENGELRYFVCFWKDVTEQDLFKTELQVSEEKLSGILDAIPIPISISAIPSGIIEYVNDAYLEVSGYPRSEIVGRAGNDLSWKDAAGRDEMSKIMLGKNRFEDKEISLVNKNGETCTSLLSGETVVFGDKKYMLTASVDITERKKAVEALIESEAFNAGLLANSPNPILVLDPDGSIRYANTALEKLTGYSSSELKGTNAPYPWWPPEFYQYYIDQNRLKPLDDLDKYERTYIKKNGERYYCAVSVNNVKQAGITKYHILNWVDITERKKAEDALRESEAFNAGLLTNSPNPILVLNPDGSIRYVNHALEVLTGYSSEEISGFPPFPWWPPELHQFYNQDYGITKDSDTGIFERRYRKKNGEAFWCSVNVRHIKQNDSFKYQIINWLDITEQKKAETALKESEAFNARLLHDAPNPILLADAEKKIHYVNPAFEKLTEYSAAEVIGQLPPFPWWPRDKYDQYNKDKDRQPGESANNDERVFVKKSGREFWAKINVQSIYEEGSLKFILANWVDITDRKKMEDRIVDLYLKEKLQREELQEEAKARGLFINVLAHDLRTPVTPILVSIGLLKDKIDNNPDRVQKKLVDNIFLSTNLLARRLEELLDLGRYSRGSYKLQIQPVNLRQCIEKAVSQIQALLEQKNQSLSLDITELKPVVEADASRVEQALVILLTSTGKFSPGRAILELSLKARENGFVIDIRGNGSELSIEDQIKLFQPYHRVEQDRQQFPGLGLELALARYIIEAHGGKIWINSEPGKGINFSFYLPSRAKIPAVQEPSE